MNEEVIISPLFPALYIVVVVAFVVFGEWRSQTRLIVGLLLRDNLNYVFQAS